MKRPANRRIRRLFPTLADLTGLAPSSGLHRVLIPLLKDPRRLGSSRGHPGAAREANGFMGYTVRTEQWRYTEWDDGSGASNSTTKRPIRLNCAISLASPTGQHRRRCKGSCGACGAIVLLPRASATPC